MTTITLDRPAAPIDVPTIGRSAMWVRAAMQANSLTDLLLKLHPDERRSIVYGALVALLRGGMTASELECLLAHAAQEVDG